MACLLNSYIFGKKGQAIQPFAVIPATDINTTFTIAKPLASSGLPVVVSIVSGPATITSQDLTTATITTTSTTGTKDIVTLAANQPGDGEWAPAPQVTTTFMVVDIEFHAFGITVNTNLV
jgi:hypothetical protein